MGARRNLRRGGGGGVAKKRPHGEKGPPPKEKNVAKRPQHGEQVAKRLPNNEIKIFFSMGEGASAYSCPPMLAPMSIFLKYLYIFS